MAVTGTSTVRDIVTAAMRRAGITAVGEEMDAADAQYVMDELNRMLKAWQAADYLSLVASQSVTLTTAASYTLDPVRPIRIHSVRLKRSGSETPMWDMTRSEYDELPRKDTQGTPTSYYYDRQREAAVLYIWPVLSAAAGETLEITYERELVDVTSLSDVIDLPAEWYDATVSNLAYRAALDYDRPPQRVMMLKSEADMAKLDAMAFYNEAVLIERR